MLINIQQKDLAESLQLVSRAIPSKTPLSELEGVLLTGDGEKLSLFATNLEMGLKTELDIEHKAGSVVLPGKIVEIIRRLPGETVVLKVNTENFLTEITSGTAEFQVFGLNAADYPSFPAFSSECSIRFSVKSEDLRRVLKQTIFSVSQEDLSPAFTGILFTLSEKDLQLASSDTFRLAVTSCPVKNRGEKGSFLVPARTLQEVIRVFPASEEEIQVAVLQNQLLLNCNNIYFSSRLLTEKYPDVKRVIPQKFVGRAVVETAAMLQAIERAAILSAGENNIVSFTIADNIMHVRASSKYGIIQEKIPVALEGEEVKVSLNSRFVLDILRIVEGNNCVLELTGSDSPVIIRDNLHQDYLYLVLPIKL